MYNVIGDNEKGLSVNSFLGHGVYSVAEAARYTSLNANTIRSWFKSGKKLFDPRYSHEACSIALDFSDLIDVMVAGHLRQLGVRMSEVRAAHAILSKELETSHPFCHSDLRTDGGRVFLATADKIGSEKLSEVVSKQYYSNEIMKPYLKHVQYSAKTSLAERWLIFKGVVIDPEVGLGKPVLEKTGVPTNLLARAYLANGRDVDLAASLYNVTPGQVRTAIQFEQQFGSLPRMAA